MSEPEIHYEMLWDCAQCHTRGLLGEAQRHCPVCGAAQDPAARYFPPEGEEVEAKNHRYVGVDWSCAYCHSPNSKAAAHCTNCGAGQDGSKPVALKLDGAKVPVPAVQGPETKPGSPLWRWMLAGCAVLLMVLGIMFFHTSEVTATVAERTWQREIQVERFGPVAETAWCDSLPSDAYAVTQSREQRSTRRVEDGQTCRDERIDKGDGTFVKHRECTPRYREQPVYDNRCRYQVNRWRTHRIVKAGPDIAMEPMWPSLAGLQASGQGLAGSAGAEREGARNESYTLHLESGGKRWSCAVSEGTWRKYVKGNAVPVKVRTVGGLDCSSLN
jgi:hypothetical protein